MSNECPFTPGEQYKVLRRIDELGHAFTPGEVVVFKAFAYDAHNGVTRFWFERDNSQVNVWHVWDTDPPALEQWEKHFKQV